MEMNTHNFLAGRCLFFSPLRAAVYESQSSAAKKFPVLLVLVITDECLIAPGLEREPERDQEQRETTESDISSVTSYIEPSLCETLTYPNTN